MHAHHDVNIHDDAADSIVAVRAVRAAATSQHPTWLREHMQNARVHNVPVSSHEAYAHERSA